MSAGILNPSAGLGSNMPSDPAGELIARQKLAELLSGAKGRYNDTSPKQHWMQALAQVADGAVEGLSARQQLAATLAGQQQANGLLAQMPLAVGAGGSAAARLPAMAGGNQAMVMPSGDSAAIQGKFTDALKAGGLTNPYGLAAMTAYAQHESRYNPKNIGGTWSDPSESGEGGTSGGILSWRNERLRNMQASTAGAQDPVAAQAKFALAENPDLTLALQNAKSPEEANALMADAWKFAGYNRPGGGEYANRLATTQAYASKFAGAGGAAGPQASADAPADMPAPNAKPVDMAADDGGLPRTPDGFAIPPAPGQGPSDPAQAPAPSSLRDDLAALFSKAPMGDPQGFSGTSGTIMDPDAADMPAPGAQPASASAAPMQVPLPPARPSDADLQAPAPPPAPPAPSPARQQLVAAMAQPRTDAPDPQAAPGPAPRQGIAALLGGMQDGLDRVFGGPQTQARLDGQAGPRQQLVQALAPPPPAAARYASLPPTGQPGQVSPPSAPSARVAAQPMPQPAPDAAPQTGAAQPVQVAQAGGGSDQDAQVAWAQRVMAASANPAVAKMLPLAQEILKRRFEGNYSQVEQDGRVLNRAPNGQLSVAYDKSKDDQDKWGTFTDQATGVTYQYKKGSTDAPRALSPGGERGQRVVDIVDPAERAAAGVPVDYRGAVQRDASGKLSFPSAGGVNVTTNLGPKANEALDGTIIKKIEESQSKAEGAIGTIKAINRQKEAIDKGLVTGWGADWQTQAKAAVAKILGLPDNALTNSEVFDAASTQKSAELAKAISQAGHTTNMDLQLGKTIAGGNRELTEKAIRAIVDAQERLALDTIEAHNAKVSKFAKINPSVADRAGWFQVEAPETYQYGDARAGQGGRAPVASSAAPAPAAAPDRAALEAEARRRGLIR